MYRGVAVAALALAAAVAVVLVLAYTARPLWLPAGRGGGRAAGGGAAGKSGAAGRAVQPLCVLDAANGSGYTVHVKRLGGQCPSVWAYSVEARRGWRLRGVELAANGTARRLNASGYVELSGNATLRVEAERVRVAVRVIANASASGYYSKSNGVAGRLL